MRIWNEKEKKVEIVNTPEQAIQPKAEDINPKESEPKIVMVTAEQMLMQKLDYIIYLLEKTIEK
jgi:hypothetical protein